MTTTTGSIDAKLTVDDSDFKRGMAEAKAEAREVGALEPTVKVDANVGPALAKLNAVALAERNLDVAYQRSAIAQTKLDAITKKYGDDSVQAATARLGMTRATNAESDAEAKLAGHRHAATAAQDKDTEATHRANGANNQRIRGLQVLIALSPAILAAAAPIGAAALGLGAAFGVMAVSGVLAIKGIKDEMAHGTVVGNEYAAGLGSLKTDLNQLSQTSAVAMLGAFNTVVGDINARMPFLNRLVGDSSAALGAMGGTALHGVLDGMQAMTPLIQAGTVELSKFVTWLSSFSNTNGFSQFVGYAVDNLPGVMVLIENLVTTAGHILAAFAPLGPVVLGFLNMLTDGLNSLPLPVLAGLVTTAALLGTTLKLAFSEAIAARIGVVAAQIGLTGVMANLAVPVVGILTAVIAGLGMAAATSALGTDTGTAAIQDYTQALKDDNDALGEHIRAQAAKALSDAGAFDAARDLGISQKTLTDATLGVAGAQDIVNGAIKRGREFQNDWSQGVVDVTTGMYQATGAQDQMGKSIELVTGQVRGQSGAIDGAKQKNADLAAAMDTTAGAATGQAAALQASAAQYGTSVGMYQAATAAQEKTAAQLAQTTLNMQLQNNAAGLLKQSMDSLNGTSLSLEQAQTRSAAATNSVTASFVQNGTAIRGGTAAAVSNQQALQNKAAADQAAAEAVAKSTGSTKAGTKAYGASKTALENSMRAQGLLTGGVQAYINKLYNVDKLKVKPTKLEVDKARAEADLAAFQAHVDALRGKVIDVITRNSSIGDGTAPSSGTAGRGIIQGFATGGEVAYLASGGQPWQPRGTDTVPAMLTPGEIVVNRASVQSLGAGNVLEANRTGQWPVQQQATGPVTVGFSEGDRKLLMAVVQLAHRPVAVKVGAETIATANIVGRKKLRLPV
ncbi:hypothetical protein V3C33_13735 [Micrococcaceae bacterium Sec5.7]